MRPPLLGSISHGNRYPPSARLWDTAFNAHGIDLGRMEDIGFHGNAITFRCGRRHYRIEGRNLLEMYDKLCDRKVRHFWVFNPAYHNPLPDDEPSVERVIISRFKLDETGDELLVEEKVLGNTQG